MDDEIITRIEYNTIDKFVYYFSILREKLREKLVIQLEGLLKRTYCDVWVIEHFGTRDFFDFDVIKTKKEKQRETRNARTVGNEKSLKSLPADNVDTVWTFLLSHY